MMMADSEFKASDQFDPIQIKDLIDITFKKSIVDLLPISGADKGQQSNVFSARMGTDRIFIKVGKDPRSAAIEVRCLKLCAHNGLSVPEVIGYAPNTLYFGRPITLLSALEGRPLSSITDDGVKSSLFYRAGAILRQIHSIRIEGFDTLSHRDDRVKEGPISSIKNSQSVLSHIEYAKNNNLVDKAEVAILETLYIRRLALIASGSSLLHGDFQAPHIFTNDNKITGIIDFGNGSVGDQLGDIATSLFYLKRDLHKPFLDGYGIHGNCPALPEYLVFTALRKTCYRHINASREDLMSTLDALRGYMKAANASP